MYNTNEEILPFAGRHTFIIKKPNLSAQIQETIQGYVIKNSIN